MLFHVVAMARNRVIGKANHLPWHFSDDLRHFKKLTVGQTVLMGRKTFEGIGKPLPHRENFILSRKVQGDRGVPSGVRYFDSVEKAMSEIRTEHGFIIGGADLFRQTLGGISGIYLTVIDAEFEGDAFYPPIPACFRERSRHVLSTGPLIEVVFLENTAPDVFLKLEPGNAK